MILDRDLLKMYNCKNGTKTINQAVKRNIERFPQIFMFQLNELEYDNKWYKVGTRFVSGTQKYRSKENLPYAFTEQEVVKHDIIADYIYLYKERNDLEGLKSKRNKNFKEIGCQGKNSLLFSVEQMKKLR